MTGGGRGLGRGMALALAAGGAKVMVAARTEEQLLGVVDEIRQAGGTATHFVYDATSEGDANERVGARVGMGDTFRNGWRQSRDCRWNIDSPD